MGLSERKRARVAVREVIWKWGQLSRKKGCDVKGCGRARSRYREGQIYVFRQTHRSETARPMHVEMRSLCPL